MSPSESQETQSESIIKGKDSAKYCEPEETQPSPGARGETQINLVSRERLSPSSRSERSLGGVLASHKRLSPSPEVSGEAQLSPVSRERLSSSPRSEGGLE